MNKEKVGIYKYLSSNSSSLTSAFDKISVAYEASNKLDDLLRFKKIIIPGIGNMKNFFNEIQPLLFAEKLRKFINNNGVIYGICLGMQVFLNKSEEGNIETVGIINGESIALKKDFISESLSEEETKSIIKKIYKNYNILIDPHTAVGLGVLDKLSNNEINIILSTAHPGKFPEVIKDVTGKYPELPDKTKKVIEEKEKFDILPNDLNTIKKFIKVKVK